ncbi:MAG: NADPH:quinone reductase [Phycisphaeraceae bacterium]|nr:NADPH:quinone reductase [Phycisphaeraceae bacterium]
MRAIQVHAYGKSEGLQCDEVPDLTPRQDQILIEVKATGVNPVDTYIRSGVYPIKPELPYTPGSDCGGIVAATGSGVTEFAPGDRVYTHGSVTGTYAEYCLCTSDQTHALPDVITFEQGAALGVPYATAYHALVHKARAASGQTVLIHGASGGVGTAAIQLAHSMGLTVVGTAGTQAGLDLVLRLGADHVVNHHDTGRVAMIQALTQDRGVDIILEMLANVNLAADLELLAVHGKVVVIGNRGTIEINPRLLMAKDASVQGMILMHATPQEKKMIFEGIHTGLLNQTLVPVIGESIPLDEASRAHDQVISGSHQGKIVLIG